MVGDWWSRIGRNGRGRDAAIVTAYKCHHAEGYVESDPAKADVMRLGIPDSHGRQGISA